MIELYSGTPGSGKSLHTASVILWRLKRNAPIIANFDVNLEKIYKPRGSFYYVDNLHLTPEFLIDFANNYWSNTSKPFKEDSLLLIIDECQLLFNAREWNISGRGTWLSFFTQHRKYGYKIILVAQFDRMIDRQIRSLIEYEYVHRKAKNFGWRGWLISFWCLGNLFMCKKVWYPMKEKVDSEYFLCRKKYYSLYDTRNTFATSEAEGGESSADGVV